MTLLPERQMKNIWIGVSVPTEHKQTTTDLSAISTEALFQYQTVLFWHTDHISIAAVYESLALATTVRNDCR